MKTEHVVLGTAAALGLGYWLTRKPARKKKRTDGGGGEGQGVPPKQCRAGQVWNAKLGRCVWKNPKLKTHPPGPAPTCDEGERFDEKTGKCVSTWTEVPDEYPPLPAPLAAQWCSTPQQIEPELVGTLLLAYALPAYLKAMGGELAPSSTQMSEGRGRVRKVLLEHCGVPSPAMGEAIDDFAKAAEVIYMRNGRVGQPIALETAINRICNYDGSNFTLDTHQTLVLVCDLGMDAIAHGANRDQLAQRMLECSDRPAPVSEPHALALAQTVASIALAAANLR